MRTLVAAAMVLSLSAPAVAQVSSSSLAGPEAVVPPTGAIADPGGLSLGGGGISGTAGTTSNPGGHSFGRTSGTGSAPSGTGAGIATGSTGVPSPDDTYLYPLYGKSFR